MQAYYFGSLWMWLAILAHVSHRFIIDWHRRLGKSITKQFLLKENVIVSFKVNQRPLEHAVAGHSQSKQK